MKKTAFAIVAATLWISISEFVRNEFLLKSYWTEHYANMGLVFPAEPINGAIWGLWSLCFATLIYVLSRRFSSLHTTVFAWVMGFVLMWLVIGNLSVLPWGILTYAIPLSIFEAWLAQWLVRRIDPPASA